MNSLLVNLSSDTLPESMLSINDVALEYQMASSLLETGVITNSSELMDGWVDARMKLNNAMAVLTTVLPPSPNASIDLFQIINSTYSPVLAIHQQIYDLFYQQNWTGASDLLFAQSTNSAIQQMNKQWQQILYFFEEYAKEKAQEQVTWYLVGLIVICSSLVIGIPIVIITFSLSIVRERKSMAKLRETQIIVLLQNTMNDGTLRKDFKQFCSNKSKKLEANVTLLEIIGRFKNMINTLQYIQSLRRYSSVSSEKVSSNLLDYGEDSESSTSTNTTTSTLLSMDPLALENEEVQTTISLKTLVQEIMQMIDPYEPTNECKIELPKYQTLRNKIDNISHNISPSVFDALQKEIADRVIEIHEQFLLVNAIPGNKSRFQKLREFRIDFKKEYSKQVKTNKSIKI